MSELQTRWWTEYNIILKKINELGILINQNSNLIIEKGL